MVHNVKHLIYLTNVSRSDSTKRSWSDPRVRALRSRRISEVQQERSADMSTIVEELWKDADFRETILAARKSASDARRANFPEKECERCHCIFKVFPSRFAFQRFCSSTCRIEHSRGTPNLKNRGKIPSKRSGSGISGSYNGKLFRSLYELSFIINVLEAQEIEAEYETMRIALDDDHSYIPDFVSHSKRAIYEVKYEKALSQPKVIIKLEAGRNKALSMGYTFEVYTEKRMTVLTFNEVVEMVKVGTVRLHHKKNGGIRYKQLLKKLNKQ